MDKLMLILITGRSTGQGTGISKGKHLDEYREATSAIDLNGNDMIRAGLNDGDSVLLKTPFGAVDVVCHQADIPEGLAFMAFGSTCNHLIGGETYASGMPDSKYVEVEITKVV